MLAQKNAIDSGLVTVEDIEMMVAASAKQEAEEEAVAAGGDAAAAGGGGDSAKSGPSPSGKAKGFKVGKRARLRAARKDAALGSPVEGKVEAMVE
eukprot:jgi/Mesen1/7452/ME000389S06800